MGTWGAAIFADDFACDVREAYLDKLANGMAAAAASRAMIEEYGADGLDVDEGPTFWIALAATQWEYGALAADVKRRALALLDTGAESIEAGHDRRRSVVRATLAKKLRTPPPRPRRPRRRKAVDSPSHGVDSPDGSAHASAFIIGNLAQVAIEVRSLGGGGGVFAAECAVDDLHLRWIDDATLEISYPASARVMPAIGDPDRFYLRGRSIALRFEKR